MSHRGRSLESLRKQAARLKAKIDAYPHGPGSRKKLGYWTDAIFQHAAIRRDIDLTVEAQRLQEGET